MTIKQLYKIIYALDTTYGKEQAIEILNNLIDCMDTDSLMILNNELKK